MRPHGIMFHHFHDSQHPRGQGSISSEELEALIVFLRPAQILPAQEWMVRATRGSLRKTDLCLTFDDNLQCQFDIARPVLQRFGLTAFWFVSTATLAGQVNRVELYRAFRERCFRDIDAFYQAFFTEAARSPFGEAVATALQRFNPLSYLCTFPFYSDADRRFRFVRDEVLGPLRYDHLMESLMAAAQIDLPALARDLWMDAACLKSLHAEGHIIGLHTHTHPTRVAALSPDDQEREYRDNFMALMQCLGEPPVAMSHPCNSYDEATLAILRGLGITLGFRADMEAGSASLLELPRQDHANVMRQMQMFETACVPL
jgi:peptidoglycan/xylan/chitin deacetylase (PgdA/CDA1 family)